MSDTIRKQISVKRHGFIESIKFQLHIQYF